VDWTARGRDVDVLHACRVHVALYVPRLLDAGAAASSTSHRLSALSSCYRHLVEHDLIATNSAAAVRQPASTRTTPPPSGWTATRRAFIADADTDTDTGCAPRPPLACCTSGCASTSSPPTLPISARWRPDGRSRRPARRLPRAPRRR